MISTRWLEKRKPHWARLEELAHRSKNRGVAALNRAELRELGLLYRQTASDLATVREDPTSQQMSVYLNQLLGRAHNLVYSARRPGPGGILHFYRDIYPKIFRETFPYTLAAFALFLAAGVAGFLMTLADPSFQRFFLGAEMADTIERRRMWTHSVLTMQPLASSAIMTNNLAVSFAAFASGILAGLGTVWMMLVNGMLFGVINAACWQAGMALQLWGFVAPHGVLELPAIFLAGGGGLMLARGMLFPGLLRRRDALVRAGGQAVRLVLGAVPLLIVAGVIEGFLSPVELPVMAKFLFAAAMGTLLVAYLTRAGRGPAPE